MCKVVYILAIVVIQTKELLYMSDANGQGPFTNGHQLVRVHTNLAMANYVAYIIDLTLNKCTFLHLCTELVNAKAG